jgi:hypothetical protein
MSTPSSPLLTAPTCTCQISGVTVISRVSRVSRVGRVGRISRVSRVWHQDTQGARSTVHQFVRGEGQGRGARGRSHNGPNDCSGAFVCMRRCVYSVRLRGISLLCV